MALYKFFKHHIRKLIFKTIVKLKNINFLGFLWSRRVEIGAQKVDVEIGSNT